MDINKEHAPGISGDGVGDTVLQASFPSGFETNLDNGADVSLNDIGQRRIVSRVILFFLLWIEAALWHKTVSLS